MKRFKKISSNARGLLFTIFLGTLACTYLARAEDIQALEPSETSDSTEASAQDFSFAHADHLQVLHDAIEFLESEGRFEELDTLSKKLAPIQDFTISEKIVNFHVRHKNRINLFNFLNLIFADAACKDKRKAKSEVCRGIVKLWKQNLDSILFFEDSPGKLIKSQKFVEKGDCVQADLLIRELENKEGFNLPIVDTHIRIADCQRNQELRIQLEQRRQEMRVLSGEI